jgi:hypothetical protein
LIAILNKVESALESVSVHADKAVPRIATAKLREHSNMCRALANTLREFLPVGESINALKAMATVPQPIRDEIATLEKAVSALPDSTKQDASTLISMVAAFFRPARTTVRGIRTEWDYVSILRS